MPRRKAVQKTGVAEGSKSIGLVGGLWTVTDERETGV